MSILDSIRKGTESGAMKLLLAIIVIVFVFWGVGSGGQGAATQVVAMVDGERITDTRFHKALRNAAQGVGRTLSEEEQSILARQVLNELIVETVMLQEARRLGIHVSDEEIARQILEYPAFKDVAGNFSQELYERALKRSGSTRGQFEEDIRNQLRLARLHGMALEAQTVTEQEVMDAWRDGSTLLELQVVRATPLAFYDDISPSPEELEAFVSEEEARVHARYRQFFQDRYHEPARATVSAILLKSGEDGFSPEDIETRGEMIAEQARAGADFADLARKYSEDMNAERGGLLGTVHADQLEPAVAEAIFGSETAPTEAGIRSPVHTDRGLMILNVHEVLPEETIPKEEVAEELALEIMKEQEAPELARRWAQEVLQEWSREGPPPTALLDAQEIVPMEVGPISLAQTRIQQLPPLPGLMDALREAEAGEVLETLFEAEGSLFLVSVVDRIDPDPARMDEELPMVRLQLAARKKMSFVQEWRDDLVARAKVEQHRVF